MNYALQTLVLTGAKAGSVKKIASGDMTIDFAGVRIGADLLAITQGGSGGTAYFDFAGKKVKNVALPLDTENDAVANVQFVKNFVKLNTGGFNFQPSVKSILTAPPSSPVEGERYLVGEGATGAWLNKDNLIAEYNGSAWSFTTPVLGWFLPVDDVSNGIYQFSGSAWLKKDWEATTASKGLKLVGRDVRRDDAESKTNLNSNPITIRQVVFLGATGVDLAIASDTSIFNKKLGLVEDASIGASEAGKVTFTKGAVIEGFAGLVDGEEYFLSNTVAGGISRRADLTYSAGDGEIRVGFARGSDKLELDPCFKWEL